MDDIFDFIFQDNLENILKVHSGIQFINYQLFPIGLEEFTKAATTLVLGTNSPALHDNRV